MKDKAEGGAPPLAPEDWAKAAYPCHPDCAVRAYHVKKCVHAALPGLLTEMTFHIRAAEARRDAAWREAVQEMQRAYQNRKVDCCWPLDGWDVAESNDCACLGCAPLRALLGSVATDPKGPSSSSAERHPDPEGAVLRDSTHSEER